MAIGTRTLLPPGTSLLDGAVGGIISGIIMGLVSMILFVALRIGSFWQPMYLIAAVVNQEWGMLQRFDIGPLVVRMVIHLAVSLILGAVWAWIISQTAVRQAALVILSLVAFVIVWAVAQFIILPAIDPMLIRVFPLWLWLVAHAVYGLVLGLYLTWRWSTAAVAAPAPTGRM